MAHEGWHRALDVQMDIHKWSSSDKGRAYNIGFFGTVLEKVMGVFDPDSRVVHPDVRASAAELQNVYVEALYRGDTMFVTSDMLHVLMQAAQDLPDDAVLDEKILITDRGFCMFEEPIMGTDLNGKATCMNGMVWQKEIIHRKVVQYEEGECQLGLIIYFLVDPYDQTDAANIGFPELLRDLGLSTPPLTLNHFYPVVFGQTVPNWDEPGSGLIKQMLKIFIAMQLIAQQKLGEPMQVRPDRAARKRWARDYKDMPEKLITLITLRRKSLKKDDHEPAKVEWSRRWIVKGHWHKYWYPSRGEHGYVYLHDYVKGPEDKPLIPTKRRIFNFRR